MKKSVKKTFNYLKYKKTDIIKISDYVFETYDKLESEHKRFSVAISCENDETLEIEDEKFSENQKILDNKKIYRISISCIDFRNDTDIQISIREGDHETTIKVKSNDKEWVDSKIAGINEIFDSIEPQNTLYRKYKRILFNYLSLSIGYILLDFFIKILDTLGYQGDNTSNSRTNPFLYILDKLINSLPQTKYVLPFLISWGFGAWLIFLFWNKLDRYLEGIWPNIEFCFGPEHKQYAKKQRKAWIVIISWILIPVILGILLK